MNQKIVIFDMDGTLVNSAQDITSAINLVRKEIFLAPIDKDTVVNAINGFHSNLSEVFYNTPQYLSHHRDMFEIFYHDECIKSVYSYDGIPEMLEALKSSDVRCSIATNAPAHFAKRILEHVNLLDYFDYVYGANLYASKPAPDMLNEILSNYSYHNSHTSHSFMVGDSIKDIQAAVNAEIDGVHVKWGFSKETHKNSINHPKDLLKLLDIN